MLNRNLPIKQDVQFHQNSQSVFDHKLITNITLQNKQDKRLYFSICQFRSMGKEQPSVSINKQEMLYLVIDSEMDTLNIWDQNNNRYHPIPFSRILQSQVQVKLSTEEKDIIVVICDIKITKGNIMYTITLNSPIRVTNLLPWSLSYRLSRQVIDVGTILKYDGRILKNTQIILAPIQTIEPLEESMLNGMIPEHINSLQLIVRQYRCRFRLEHLGLDEDHMTVRSLVTLGNNKKQLQVIIKIIRSVNTMHITLSTESVMLNLTSIPINFKIKQDNLYTYPSISLPKINLESESNHKAYLKLADRDLIKAQVLKYLFKEYQNTIQIFTGSLEPKNRTVLYYDSDHTTLKQDFKDQDRIQLCKFAHLTIRKIQTPFNFNLILFVPTLLVINKSSYSFYFHGPEELRKVYRNQIDYLVINDKTIDVQSASNQQAIDFNDWMRIDFLKPSTVYYAKETHQSVKLHGEKKNGKIFFRISISKDEKGWQMLIEQSPHPPVTFINKTSHKLKLQSKNQRFTEQLTENGGTIQFASKRPYSVPVFLLYYAHHYQYELLTDFTFEDRSKVFPDKLILNIQVYKDTIIVLFRPCSGAFGSDIKKYQHSLQTTTVNIFKIQEIALCILGKNNQELCVFRSSDMVVSYEVRQNKNQIKASIDTIQGFDYTGINPLYILKPKHQNSVVDMIKSRLRIDERKKHLQFNLIFSFHRHINIIEKLFIKTLPSSLTINALLGIYLIKAYYAPTIHLFKTITLISSLESDHTNNNPKPSFVDSLFIVEFFKFTSTKIELNFINFNILCSFMNRSYQKWLVRFITWVQNINPQFNEVVINYEQYNLRKFIKMLNIKNKILQLIKLFVDYPLNEAHMLLCIVFGFEQSKNNKGKINTALNLLKAAGYLATKFLKKINTYSIKQTYDQKFNKQFKNSNISVIDKILAYEYGEWIYSSNEKSTQSTSRLERYNTNEQILPYQHNHAKIKLALDNHLGNKVHRILNIVQQINQNAIIGVTTSWVVLISRDSSNKEKQHWVILKPACIFSMLIQQQNLVINADKETKIQKIVYKDRTMNKDKLQEIWQFIQNVRLSSYY